ncbi:carboxypeptidase [Chitinophaga filiformis]|uniref:S10 family peptidase n=1 Tax=Chitinophaga filiformis TaxID=104663 RepID=UPI001F2CF811|nr:carboxypeptidase [Chitinophaga filiformis]MCF6402598.1 carboxypeptidase [Chitinophaga filiformis]MCF6403484.1 carboxypeptidase [Chitinophaga filiformis]
MTNKILLPLLLTGAVIARMAVLPAQAQMKPSPSRVLAVDSSVVTKHEVTIKGQRVPYTATAGSIPVWDDEGKPIAGVFYTYYERDDVKDKSGRPLVISFNGGPGTPSVWMEIGYTGPRMLNIDDEGYPVQPYGMRDNPHSILDVADIVYVDPVNTGYSRPVSKDIPGSKFYGVNADIKYLAEWINTFVTRKGRWASPKFLIGESYGTTRVSGLALELQDAQWMYLNGVILVSPTELGILRNGPLDAALKLPYFTATAWYHKKLPADLQQKDLNDVLPEVENFTINELVPALSKGGALDDAQRKNIGARIARYSGLKELVVQENNLDVSTNLFWKELLRDQGYTVGRLDSRYRGIDRQTGGTSPDYNAELTAWLQAFTPAIHIYLRDELNYKTDLKYNMFGDVHPWDRKDDKTGENLRQAIAQNPFLHLLVQSGYYDGACDYFNAKYSMWQLDPSGKLKDRLKWEGYRSGHMMYLRKDDLAAANENLRKFIMESIPAKGQAAKY